MLSQIVNHDKDFDPLICVELVSQGRSDGKPFHHVHDLITTLRTSLKVLQRVVR